MSEYTASFVVCAATDKVPEIKVRVDHNQESNTMIVSPDVFARLKQLADLDNKNKFFEEEWRKAMTEIG